jgi:hypothetical protein
MAMGSESGNRKRKKRWVRLRHRYGERAAFITVGAFQVHGYRDSGYQAGGKRRTGPWECASATKSVAWWVLVVRENLVLLEGVVNISYASVRRVFGVPGACKQIKIGGLVGFFVASIPKILTR